MMDFARKPPTAGQEMGEAINGLIDEALEAENAAQAPRAYLGGSRLGVECLRALGYEWFQQKAGVPAFFPGRALRHFRLGHLQEDETARWLRLAGFDLHTHKPDGRQYGFAVARDPETGETRLRGHLDGCITAGPVNLPYPLLWEHKIANVKKWGEFVKNGCAATNPVYWGQMHTYLGYMDLKHALFTAYNRNTSELYFELVPFDPKVAQEMTDRGVRVIEANSPEELPRIAREATDYRCKFCNYADRCWSVPDAPAETVTAKPAWLTGGA